MLIGLLRPTLLALLPVLMIVGCGDKDNAAAVKKARVDCASVAQRTLANRYDTVNLADFVASVYAERWASGDEDVEDACRSSLREATKRREKREDAAFDRYLKRLDSKQEPKPEPAPEPEPAPPPKPKEEKHGGYTGVDAENYDIAKSVCSVFSKEKVATDLGLSPSADIDQIATEYASGYQPGFQQANYDGCLEGLLSVGD